MARFYRVVRNSPPTLRDFSSNEALGKQPRNPTPDLLRRWGAISVLGTMALAQRYARLFPRLGSYVAEIDLPDELILRLEEDQETAGHYELWAAPQDCLARVTHVERVD
jgi:hypothetical protein